MASLEKRYLMASKALKTLHNGIERYKKSVSYKESDSDYFRDALIQRFEYSIDTLWKFLKIYLQEKLQIPMEFNAPKGIIEECLNANVINRTEHRMLLKCLNNRNETSHAYNEAVAQEIILEIPDLYVTMHAILERIPPIINSNQ
jgi:nucleotidyltransferase substrate binding protein (TIGR01987 family)